MEARSAWCAFEGRVMRRVLPLFLSFVCFVSRILLALSSPMILAAVFSQNSKSCIFRTAISNCTQ